MQRLLPSEGATIKGTAGPCMSQTHAHLVPTGRINKPLRLHVNCPLRAKRPAGANRHGSRGAATQQEMTLLAVFLLTASLHEDNCFEEGFVDYIRVAVSKLCSLFYCHRIGFVQKSSGASREGGVARCVASGCWGWGRGCTGTQHMSCRLADLLIAFRTCSAKCSWR